MMSIKKTPSVVRFHFLFTCFIFVFDIAAGSMSCLLEQNQVRITEYEVFSLKD